MSTRQPKVRTTAIVICSLVVTGVLSLAAAWTLHAQGSQAALKVRHVHIWVTDVNRTKAFYRDKLGLKVSSEKPDQTVEFENGQLYFGKWRGEGQPNPSGISIGLGALSVDAVYETLKRNGVDLPTPPAPARDEWQFTLKDPDGYAISVEGPK